MTTLQFIGTFNFVILILAAIHTHRENKLVDSEVLKHRRRNWWKIIAGIIILLGILAVIDRVYNTMILRPYETKSVYITFAVSLIWIGYRIRERLVA